MILLIMGIVFMAGGIIISWPLCGVGILFVIIGIIMLATQPRQPAYYPAYGYPPTYPGQPGVAAPAPATAPCPVCGSPLTWVPQYGRWYCYRCQAYR